MHSHTLGLVSVLDNLEAVLVCLGVEHTGVTELRAVVTRQRSCSESLL